MKTKNKITALIGAVIGILLVVAASWFVNHQDEIVNDSGPTVILAKSVSVKDGERQIDGSFTLSILGESATVESDCGTWTGAVVGNKLSRLTNISNRCESELTTFVSEMLAANPYFQVRRSGEVHLFSTNSGQFVVLRQTGGSNG